MSKFRPPHLILIAFTVLVLAPLSIIGLPRELAKWHVAAALESELQGNREIAIARTEQAIRWSPSSPAWQLYRARLLADSEQPQSALEAVQAAIDLGAPQTAALPQRAGIYQQLGRFDLAVDDWKKIYHGLSSDTGGAPALIRNNMAYARALAKTELKEALHDARFAISTTDDARIRVAPVAFVKLSAAATFAELKQSQRALIWLQQAAKELHEVVHRYQSRATAVASIKPNAYLAEITAARQMLVAAHIEQYRIYHELKLKDNAEKSADMVERLNGDLKQEGWGVSLHRAIDGVETLASYFDTIGLVENHLAQSESGLAHFDLAIRLTEAAISAHQWRTEAEQFQRVDVRKLNRRSKQLQRSLAVTLYHRGMCHKTNGDDSLAEQDFQQTRELGYTPDAKLF